MSRLHPFQYVFGELAPQRFEDLREAAKRANYDLDSRVKFQRFQPVLDLLSELVPSEALELTGAVMEQYATLLYVAYRYWSAGLHTFQLSRDQVRDLLEIEAADRPPVVPHGACYLQLPERLFWARIDAESPYEPMDGVFAATGQESGEVTVLAVLGLRPDRGGFSQLALSVALADWERAGETVRRPLFAPVMEGGELAGVYSVVSEGELLYLTHLALSAVRQ
ncbi:MAG: hypothetical protein KatS3mg081_1306 [Gemmatimonadales bacterium]|nr:MAG: hypothetical protein KatS3mg081_1306 [Gemmatimonadales bacterium]